MGDGTPLTLGSEAAQKARRSQRVSARMETRPRSVRLGIDVPLLLIVIMLLVFGLLMVYSTSWDYSLMILETTPTYLFNRQLIWLGVGIVVAIALSWIDYHHWQKLALPVMTITVVGLVTVLFLNIVINNAVRSLWGGSIRPSEAAKMMTVVYLAVWFYARREQLSDVNFGLIPLSAILGILGGLILLQPDLSAAAMVFILGGLLFFLAGGDTRQIVLFLVVGLAVGGAVFMLHPTGRLRLGEYWASLKDITQASPHLKLALEAIVKGGWFGVGIGRSEIKLLGLPVPPTDSIFAVVAEETGIFGTACLIFLYIMLMWRGLAIAERAPDGLGKMLAAGLSMWIFLEAVINMAVLVNLVPFAGNALPFISAGGSSLVSTLGAVGVLMSVSRATAIKRSRDERTFDAVVDLRGRDRRRSVPRNRRPAATER